MIKLGTNVTTFPAQQMSYHCNVARHLWARQVLPILYHSPHGPCVQLASQSQPSSRIVSCSGAALKEQGRASIDSFALLFSVFQPSWIFFFFFFYFIFYPPHPGPRPPPSPLFFFSLLFFLLQKETSLIPRREAMFISEDARAIRGQLSGKAALLPAPI